LRSDGVVELSVALDFDAELVAVVDLVPVEVLVRQGDEGALADAVPAGLFCLVRMWISSGCESMKAAKRAD
jgi:hypothetical protein